MINLTYNFLLGQENPNKWYTPPVIEEITIKNNELQSKITENNYTVNTITGDVYREKKPEQIRLISRVLIPAYILYGAGFATWHLLRIPFDIIKIALATFGEIGEHYPEQRYLEIAKMFYRKPIEILSYGIAINLYNLARDPIYTTLVVGASILTCLAPENRLLDGKELISSLDRKWHHGVSCKKDIRYEFNAIKKGFADITTGSILSGINKIYNAASKAEVFYLPFCFQLNGNLKDELLTFEGGIYNVYKEITIEEKLNRESKITSEATKNPIRILEPKDDVNFASRRPNLRPSIVSGFIR